jgi:hypothetical protein
MMRATFAVIRLIVGGILFAQTLRWVWAAIRERRRPRYGTLPWDPSAKIRTSPLTRLETAWARDRESGLTGVPTL